MTTDEQREGNHLAVKLLDQEKVRMSMPWYSSIKPKKAIEIPGKASALGLWVKGNSDWGRIVYCLRDANDERWISIGFKDQWNCDDLHSWSAFNFDGWRYLRFELPSHQPWDLYRDYGTTWWRSAGGDGIVDLPIRLEKVIVERRTHVIYVNSMEEADPADVLLGELVAEYGSEADTTDAAVNRNRIRMPEPESPPSLDNPIAKLATDGELPAITFNGLTAPDWGYDGTRMIADFETHPDAKQYQVWVAAYPDGRGAAVLGKLTEPGKEVRNLRPAMKLYLWVTWTDADGKQSKPSNRIDAELVDAFGQK